MRFFSISTSGFIYLLPIVEESRNILLSVFPHICDGICYFALYVVFPINKIVVHAFAHIIEGFFRGRLQAHVKRSLVN